MQRVSSNLTLIFRIFIPTFWIVFFGAFTIAVFLLDRPYYGGIPGLTFKIGAVVFYLSGLLSFYLTLFQLKRVELSKEQVYVTNYFKHIKYPFEEVEKIEESDIGVLKTATIFLKGKGSFGSTLTFIVNRKLYNQFWDLHPKLAVKVGLREKPVH